MKILGLGLCDWILSLSFDLSICLDVWNSGIGYEFNVGCLGGNHDFASVSI